MATSVRQISTVLHGRVLDRFLEVSQRYFGSNYAMTAREIIRFVLEDDNRLREFIEWLKKKRGFS